MQMSVSALELQESDIMSNRKNCNTIKMQQVSLGVQSKLSWSYFNFKLIQFVLFL